VSVEYLYAECHHSKYHHDKCHHDSAIIEAQCTLVYRCADCHYVATLNDIILNDFAP
jgi:hypothetical protein